MKTAKWSLMLGACLGSAVVLAGPPTNFGGFGYQINNGFTTITDSAGTANVTDICSQAGFTCNNAPITGNGFLQLEISDSNGNRYFQTIIADPSQGGFVSETFIAPDSQGNTGAAIQQRLGDPGGTSGLATTDTLLTGSFLQPGDTSLELRQTLWNENSAYSASDFQADFWLTMTVDAAGDNIRDLSQSQRLGDAAGVSGSGFSDSFAFDQQVNTSQGDLIVGSRIDIDSSLDINERGNLSDSTFSYSNRRGTFTSLENITYGNTSGGLSMNDGIDFDWAGGDTIAQTLISQTIIHGNMSSPMALTAAAQFSGDRPGGAFTISSIGAVLKHTNGAPMITHRVDSNSTSDPTLLFTFDAGVIDPFI